MDRDPDKDNREPFRPISGGGFSASNEYPRSSGFSVAVVGGGVAGFSSVNALIDFYARLKTGDGQFTSGNGTANYISPKVPVLSIHWFDEANNFGPGQVYQHHDNTVDLNEYAGKMSAFPDDPNDCINWLKKHHPGLYESTDGYISRATYREYLRDCTRILFEKAIDAGVSLTTFKDSRVTDVAKKSGGVEVHLEGGSKIPVRKAIIAIGHKRASIEEDPLKLGDQHPRYCFRVTGQNLSSVMDEISKIRSGTILIPGSGATMVDNLRRINSAGFRGRIVVVTRNDIMPWANRANDNPEPYQLDWNSDKIKKLATEYEISNGRPIDGKRTRVQVMDDFVSMVNDEIKKALDAKYNPRTFLDSESLSSILDDRDINQNSPNFAAEANRIIARFKANPTPARDARLIRQFIDDGRLTVIVGSPIAPPRWNANKQQFTVTVVKHDGSTEIVKCDYAFNGAPHTRDYRTSSFMQNIIGSCGGRFNHDGVIEVNKYNEIPGISGYSFIGAFAKPEGSDRDTWGVQTLIRQAQRIAGKILFDFAQDTALTPHSTDPVAFAQTLIYVSPSAIPSPVKGVA